MRGGGGGRERTEMGQALCLVSFRIIMLHPDRFSLGEEHVTNYKMHQIAFRKLSSVKIMANHT